MHIRVTLSVMPKPPVRPPVILPAVLTLVAGFALASLAAGATPATSATRATSAAPNILFILTDDQRWDALGAYGNNSIRTPNLDRLAAGGARLDAFFVASPLCSPSRASFLTGLYPHQTGVLNNAGRPDLKRGSPTVATALNAAGYVTGFVGKAHMGGDPRAWGFKQTPIWNPYARIDHVDPELMVNGTSTKLKGTVSQILADAAIKFLEANRKQRFFLWFATTAPHDPHMLFPEHPYTKDKITAPPGWPPMHEFGAADWDAYYSTISQMDEHIGRVLDALDRLGLAQDTLVIFASDNGYMMGSHGQDAKLIWFEESSRVPALVRWPGRIKPGSVIAAPISAVDFVPTVLDVAGAAKPPAGVLEGVSMMPALTGGVPLRKQVFAEAKLPGGMTGKYWQMVRDVRYKYVRFDTGEERFYDITNDPFEKRNLASDVPSAPARAAMKAELDRWVAATK